MKRFSRFLSFMLGISFASGQLHGQQLSERQAAIVRSIDGEAPAAIALLEKIVNINSGTFNTTGVIEVGKVVESEFQSLGFTTRWVPMDKVKRAPSLIAEHKGTDSA